MKKMIAIIITAAMLICCCSCETVGEGPSIDSAKVSDAV